MKSKLDAPKLLVAVGLLSASVAVCTSLSQMPAADPRAYAEAEATAQAIAPAIAPTVSYNENVIPTVQAIEAIEASETVSNAQQWRRNVDTAQGVATIGIVSSLAIGASVAVVGVGIGIGSAAGAAGVRWMKEAQLPATRLLVEGPHLTDNGVTHTATGAGWELDDQHDALPDHSRMIAATYNAIPHDVLAELLKMQQAEWGKVKLLERGDR